MKSLLFIVIIIASILITVVAAQEPVNPPAVTHKNFAARNPYFPSWVPSKYNHIILFCSGSWLPADDPEYLRVTRNATGGTLSFPSCWEVEWVHMSRDNSPPLWMSALQLAPRMQQTGMSHPVYSHLTLVLIRPDGSWTPWSHPSTAILSNGSSMYWADLSLHRPNQIPAQILEHYYRNHVREIFPLWANRYININRTDTITNGALVNSLRQFYNNYLSEMQQIYQGRNSMRRYPVDISKNIAFRNIISKGFREDKLAKIKPFSPYFLDEVLRNVNFYFSRRCENKGFVGSYGATSCGTTSYIWVATGRSDTSFASTAMHEIGHALGLGETLASLKRELFLGWSSNAIVRSNLAYNTEFDRILLNRVGASYFWEAAYHSNAAYANLWDSNFGDIIKHWELELLRGIIIHTTRHPQMETTFSKTAGTTLQSASITIHSDFVSLTNSNLDPAQWQEVFNRFRGWVNFYVAFSIENSMAASRSVLNCGIANHHLRSKKETQISETVDICVSYLNQQLVNYRLF